MSTNDVRIGVLDIQGSVEEHFTALEAAGTSPKKVKTKADLEEVDGLIIPGGESTAIGKLLKKYGLSKAIAERARGGIGARMKRRFGKTKPLAVWGTCAGAILMAKKVTNRRPDHLKLMDIAVERNAYGRQTESFEETLWAPDVAREKIPAVFIRAPRIRKISGSVQVLAALNREPVMVRQNNLLATMFHPELTPDTSVHRYFIAMTKEACRK